MKVIYTESGKQALEAYKAKKVAELEVRIKERKYVLGDDLIEVTASDIKESSEGHYAENSYRFKRFSLQKMILQIYMVFGFIAMIVGLFYGQIVALVQDRPEQLLLVVGGAAFSVICAVMLARIRAREQEEDVFSRLSKIASKEPDRDA